jgi:hypothetical protein
LQAVSALIAFQKKQIHTMNTRINNNPQDIDLTISIMQAMLPDAVKQARKITNNIIRQYPDDMTMQLARDIWTFLKKEIKYKADPIGQELIRSPEASWKVRKSGIDCEDYSLIIAAICQNLNIKCRYRIVDFNGMGWSHIYVIATNKIGREFIIDPVHEKFNHGDSFVKFEDFEVVGRMANKPTLGRAMKKVTFRTYKTMGLGRIGVDPVTARAKGCFLESGNTYCRQPKLKEMIVAKDTKVSFAFDKIIDAKFAIISADKLQPSHLGNVENPLHFLPEAQPRNRATSQSGADTPRLMAENLRPAEIIEGANAYTGCPVVNSMGEVIQGNGRAYAIKYYYDNFPTDPKGYIKYLLENQSNYRIEIKGDYGSPSRKPFVTNRRFDDDYIFKPVLVRMADISDEEAIKLGQYKQSDLEALSTKSNDLKSRVNLIDDAKLSRVLDNVFVQAAPDATLSEIIRSTNILTQLIRLGAIRSDQLEEFIRNDKINAQGVNYVADLLLYMIFKGSDTNTAEVYSQIPVRVQNAILKATPSLLRVEENKQIRREISNAILATRDFQNSGQLSVAAWEKQTNMFGSVKDQYTDFERKIVDIFTKSNTQKEIVEVFEKYANAVTDQAADLVSEGRKGLSKEQGVRFAFFSESPVSHSSKTATAQAQRIRILKLKYKYQTA